MPTIDCYTVKNKKSWSFVTYPRRIQRVEIRRDDSIPLEYSRQNEIKVVDEGIAINVGKEGYRFMPNNRFDLQLNSRRASVSDG